MKATLLAVSLTTFFAHAASAKTIMCNQGDSHLFMKIEGAQILSSWISHGDSQDETYSVDINDITFQGGSDAYIRVDVQYQDRGQFINCHAL
jgi:hypothetical protein